MNEEAQLVALAKGGAEADAANAARADRYKLEDAGTAELRANEDRLNAEGAAHRAATKAALQAAIAHRADTPEKRANDKIEALAGKLAKLEAEVAAHDKPVDLAPAPEAPAA